MSEKKHSRSSKSPSKFLASASKRPMHSSHSSAVEASESEMAIVGRLGAVFGLKGWIKVNSFSRPKTDIQNYPQWWLKQDTRESQWQMITPEGFHLHGQILLVKLPFAIDRTAIEPWVHAWIGVPRQQLPSLPSDEFYWSDLEGCEVFNHEGVYLGVVDYLIESGGHDTLVLKGEHPYLIPFVWQLYILAVDVNSKKITVEWDRDFY